MLLTVHLQRALSTIGRFSNRTGTSDDDGGAHGMVWIVFLFDRIWIFVVRAPSSSEVPVLLLNQPNTGCEEESIITK